MATETVELHKLKVPWRRGRAGSEFSGDQTSLAGWCLFLEGSSTPFSGSRHSSVLLCLPSSPTTPFLISCFSSRFHCILTCSSAPSSTAVSSVTSLPGCGSASNLFYSLLVSRQTAARQWSPPLGPVRSPRPLFLPWVCASLSVVQSGDSR